MGDEGALRERFPEIPWDQPVSVKVARSAFGEGPPELERWCCRYCIALHGLNGSEVSERGYVARWQALDHIEQVHHTPTPTPSPI